MTRRATEGRSDDSHLEKAGAEGVSRTNRDQHPQHAPTRSQQTRLATVGSPCHPRLAPTGRRTVDRRRRWDQWRRTPDRRGLHRQSVPAFLISSCEEPRCFRRDTNVVPLIPSVPPAPGTWRSERPLRRPTYQRYPVRDVSVPHVTFARRPHAQVISRNLGGPTSSPSVPSPSLTPSNRCS